MISLETKYKLTDFEIKFLTRVLNCKDSELESVLDSKNDTEYYGIMFLLKLSLYDEYLK